MTWSTLFWNNFLGTKYNKTLFLAILKSAYSNIRMNKWKWLWLFAIHRFFAWIEKVVKTYPDIMIISLEFSTYHKGCSEYKHTPPQGHQMGWWRSDTLIFPVPHTVWQRNCNSSFVQISLIHSLSQGSVQHSCILFSTQSKNHL